MHFTRGLGCSEEGLKELCGCPLLGRRGVVLEEAFSHGPVLRGDDWGEETERFELTYCR